MIRIGLSSSKNGMIPSEAGAGFSRGTGRHRCGVPGLKVSLKMDRIEHLPAFAVSAVQIRMAQYARIRTRVT